PALLPLLANEQLDDWVRGSIVTSLGRLGDHSIVPDLFQLLRNEQLDDWVRQPIADVLGQFIQDQVDLYKLAALLAELSISDRVYSAVWQISRRMGVRVFETNQGKIKIEKMP
ncbi:MAG: HEAT repeat domain-containing protein, partial [Chloroflexota bacterium]|nr:HEAT repeat domain-containing protein [Chloroflexota bacterium]